jgi:hypothetical protein
MAFEEVEKRARVMIVEQSLRSRARGVALVVEEQRPAAAIRLVGAGLADSEHGGSQAVAGPVPTAVHPASGRHLPAQGFGPAIRR